MNSICLLHNQSNNSKQHFWSVLYEFLSFCVTFFFFFWFCYLSVFFVFILDSLILFLNLFSGTHGREHKVLLAFCECIVVSSGGFFFNVHVKVNTFMIRTFERWGSFFSSLYDKMLNNVIRITTSFISLFSVTIKMFHFESLWCFFCFCFCFAKCHDIYFNTFGKKKKIMQ